VGNVQGWCGYFQGAVGGALTVSVKSKNLLLTGFNLCKSQAKLGDLRT
jgi:hypothetical protein